MSEDQCPRLGSTLVASIDVQRDGASLQLWEAARACTTCGASSWHPDVRTCKFEHCQFRVHTAERPSAEVSSLLPSALAVPAGVLSPVHNAGVPALRGH